MSDADGFWFLKSATAGHAEFHRLRIMFCLKDGAVNVALPGLTVSHIEWFESEGWATKANAKEFLENTVRGFYLPEQNALYCYKGVGWYFDDETRSKLLENAGILTEALGLNRETKLNLGPKDAVINGVRYEQCFIGTIGDLA